jgi:hypothetical protein
MTALCRRLVRQGITLEQFGFQFVVVLLGVYLAIVLENCAQDRAEEEQANAMLADVLLEIQDDEREIQAVLAAQRELQEAYGALEAYLITASLADEPGIDSLFTGPLSFNPTAFPRRAAYSSLVASGGIAAITSKPLALQLVSLYEHYYTRLIYVGELSDKNLVEAFGNVKDTEGWDSSRRKLVRRGPDENVLFRNAARSQQFMAGMYVDRLTETLAALQQVKAGVLGYLDR